MATIQEWDIEAKEYEQNINEGMRYLKRALKNFLPNKDIDMRCYQSLLYEAIMIDVKLYGDVIAKGIIINDFINDNGTIKSNIDLFDHVFNEIKNKI